MTDAIDHQDAARAALDTYNQAKGEQSPGLHTTMVDLVADLSHLAHAEGIDMDDVVRLGRMHAEEEIDQ